MRTRTRLSYNNTTNNKRKKINNDDVSCKTTIVNVQSRKRSKLSTFSHCSSQGVEDFFDGLHDDIVLSILTKLSSTATCPSDLINVLLTCKRFNGLGLNSMVLAKASPKVFSLKPIKWSENAHRFLKLCSDAGNVEACFTLGMIRFYCLGNRGSGASLMAKAAINSHAQALYSLAVIQFNGSGGAKSDKDLRAGVALCARAAFIGHVDALRELGHCLQDGYGVKQNIAEGRRFLVQANARELASALSSSSVSCVTTTATTNTTNTTVATTNDPAYWFSYHHPATATVAHGLSHHPCVPNSVRNETTVGGANTCPLLSDFGCNVPAPEAHPANKFLVEWFEMKGEKLGDGLRLCSHKGCGRPETRRHEFRRCSVCGAVNYCSRACQALDWKLRHKAECAPVERWVVDGDGEEGNGVDNFDGVYNMDVEGGES